MFLAIKELKFTKGKFALIIFLIVLISYLVYFLTSLAYGLASSYTNAINKWDADQVIITVDSNDTMMMSFMTNADYDAIETNDLKARLGLFPGVISSPDSINIDDRQNVYFFGIDEDSFLMPDEAKNLVIEGYNVLVDEELKKEGYKIGSTISISGSDMSLNIIGFTNKTTYQTAPVIYMSMSTWQAYRYNTETPPDLFSGVIVKGDIQSIPSNLKGYLIGDYIATLPGYTAQVLTFSIMIVFLIIIVAFVLGIFIYVLTIQKTPMFGVMKAQGIPNLYIAGSVVKQTFLLVLIGILVGLLFTNVTGYFLADIVPFAFNWLFYTVITAAFFLFAFFGALFSVGVVLKIDPLKAIGG